MRIPTVRCSLGLALLLAVGSWVVLPEAQASSTKEVTKHVAKPIQGKRATAAPQGAKQSSALKFNKAMQWKTNPGSHSVFAVGDNKLLWFMDPTTGWPYTIDARGIVYTADPLTGVVYDLGRLSSWAGDALYFFALWDFVDGSYRIPTLDTYVNIYVDSSYSYYAYDLAYAEVWEYQEYFVSDDFADDTIDLEYDEDLAAAEDDLAAAQASADEAEAAADEADAAADEADAAADAAADEADAAADEADAAEEESADEDDGAADDDSSGDDGSEG